MDLTQSKAFQLTEETMELLKSLDTDVEILSLIHIFRSSIGSYPNFNLDMDRSPGFGPYA